MLNCRLFIKSNQLLIKSNQLLDKSNHLLDKVTIKTFKNYSKEHSN